MGTTKKGDNISNLKLHFDSKTQCSTKSSKHSEVSKEGVAASASSQTHDKEACYNIECINAP
jgi:hypothetical protein